MKTATSDLVHSLTRVAVIGQGVIQAAKNDTATGQCLQRRKAETLSHAASTPVLRRVVEVDRGTIEEVNQVIHPSDLHLHHEPGLPQRWNQTAQHIGTAFSGLHQHINWSTLTGRTISSIEPDRLQSIRDQEQGITRSPVTPIAQGVSADG